MCWLNRRKRSSTFSRISSFESRTNKSNARIMAWCLITKIIASLFFAPCSISPLTAGLFYFRITQYRWKRRKMKSKNIWKCILSLMTGILNGAQARYSCRGENLPHWQSLSVWVFSLLICYSWKHHCQSQPPTHKINAKHLLWFHFSRGQWISDERLRLFWRLNCDSKRPRST